MSRNASGTYSLPESPFVPNTPISSTAVNNDLDDIADALTDSLSRTGLGSMQTVLSLAVSGFSYSSDPDTGMSRTSANTQVLTVGGSNYTFTPTDVTDPNGVSLLPLIGEVRIWALPTAPTGWFMLYGQACTTTYPLWRAALVAAGNPYGTSGSDPLFPDLRCVVPAGKGNMGGGDRGLLSGSTTLGAFLGEQSRTLTTPNLPAYTPSGGVSTSTSTTISGQGGLGVTTGAGGGGTSGGGVIGPPSFLSASSSSSSSFAGNAQGGTSTAFGIVQPTIVLNFIGRAA